MNDPSAAQIKTTVEHPEQEGAVHEHNNMPEVNFGCDEEWFVERHLQLAL